MKNLKKTESSAKEKNDLRIKKFIEDLDERIRKEDIEIANRSLEERFTDEKTTEIYE